jgi:hypothetical protein
LFFETPREKWNTRPVMGDETQKTAFAECQRFRGACRRLFCGFPSDLSFRAPSADTGSAARKLDGEESKQPAGGLPAGSQGGCRQERDRGEVASKAGKPVGESTWREVRRTSALDPALFAYSPLIFIIRMAGSNQVAKEKR